MEVNISRSLHDKLLILWHSKFRLRFGYKKIKKLISIKNISKNLDFFLVFFQNNAVHWEGHIRIIIFNGISSPVMWAIRKNKKINVFWKEIDQRKENKIF